MLELCHPDDRDQCREKVRRLFTGVTQSAQLEQRFVHHDGHPVWVSLSASLVRDVKDEPMYLVCQVEDIGERRASGEALAHQAAHDPLTGLPNRLHFVERLGRELTGAERRRGRLAVLFLDLDRFKVVNDSLGHSAGDRLLVEIAHVLQQVSRESDVLVRWGGEEFLVLGRFVDRAQAGVYAERIRRAVEAHVTTLDGGQTLRVTCSVGFSVFPFDPATPDAVGWEQIVSLADHGAYTAKRLGRNRSVGYVAGAGGLPASTHHATAADLQAWIAAGRLQCVTPDAAPEIAAAIA
jgi:diguanylate cyclase (GGDEF)-like protein